MGKKALKPFPKCEAKLGLKMGPSLGHLIGGMPAILWLYPTLKKIGLIVCNFGFFPFPSNSWFHLCRQLKLEP
jgi:hypothetical protein